MTAPGSHPPSDRDEATWTPALRRATFVLYLTTAILFLLFPLSLGNWLDDKDLSAHPMIRTVVVPAVEAIGAFGPAGWNAAIRDRAKSLMQRPE